VPEIDWTQAKCSGDPELMFPPTGRAHKKQRQHAKELCRGRAGRAPCPLREACRDDAVAHGDYNGGIYGGLSDRERKVFVKTGFDAAATVAGGPINADAGLPGRNEARDRPRRVNRADAAGPGGRRGGAKKKRRPARQRTGEVVVLSSRRVPKDHGCSTARGVGEDAVAGDLRGRPRRPRQVAAMGPSTGSPVGAVALRRLRVIMDGDIA
jgi:hypothetical protein